MPVSEGFRQIFVTFLILLFLAVAAPSAALNDADPVAGRGSEPPAAVTGESELNEVMTDIPHSGIDKSGSQPSESDPLLEKALGHLSRAIVLKRGGDIQTAIAEFLKAVEISPKVTSYNDEGIIIEIIGKYLKISKSRGSAASYDQSTDDEETSASNPGSDRKKVQILAAEITDLNSKIADLEKEISSNRDEFEEKEKEYAAEIEKLREELKDADHMRAVYKGRWLRLKDD